MIAKADLRLGNIFKEGIVCKINGRAGSKVHVCGRLEYRGGRLRNRTEIAAESLTPIEIDEDVAKWVIDAPVGFGKFINTTFRGIFSYNFQENKLQGDERFEIRFLHELQNLYYAIYKEELEIKE